MKLIKIGFFVIIFIGIMGLAWLLFAPKNHKVTAEKLKISLGIASSTSIALSQIFPQQMGVKWHFNGPFESGKSMRVENIVHEDGKTVLIIKGNEDDVSDGEAGDTSFDYKYVITGETIEDTSLGIILKKPLQIGNSWQHLYRINGQNYNAKTKITEIRGEFIITETVVTGIEGYYQDKYLKNCLSSRKRLGFYAETIEEDRPDNIYEYSEDSVGDIAEEFEVRNK